MTPDEAAALEESWRNRVEPAPGCFGWEPYPLERFGPLLRIAEAACAPTSWLEVGCGPGTKMLLAQGRGFSVTGFDVIPEFVEAARGYGLLVQVADARAFSYAGWGCVYINHPLVDPDEEETLEEVIFADMDSGAVLVTVNAGAWPEGWERLGGDEIQWTGVFRKP